MRLRMILSPAAVAAHRGTLAVHFARLGEVVSHPHYRPDAPLHVEEWVTSRLRLLAFLELRAKTGHAIEFDPAEHADLKRNVKVFLARIDDLRPTWPTWWTRIKNWVAGRVGR